MRWDVITAGGGLAGTAFAISLAKAGAKVLLIEKKRHAHHKVCGEFLSEESLILLKKLDINPLSLGASPKRQLRLLSGQQEARSKLPFSAVGFSRYKLDQILLNKAADHGVEIERGSAVKSFEFEEDKITAKVKDKTYCAKAAGYGTGKLNIRNITRPLSPFVGFKVMLDLSCAARQELKNTVQIMAYDGGYQGIQLVEEDKASLCWLVNRKQARILGTDLRAHLNFLARQSDIMGDMLQDAQSIWQRPLAISVPHYGFIRREIIHQRLYPIGDQMAVIPSFSGDGMAVALGSGLAAAQCMASNQSAETYQKMMTHNLKSQFFWARAGNSMILSSFGRLYGIRVATVIPYLVRFLANATRFKYAASLGTMDPQAFHI